MATLEQLAEFSEKLTQTVIEINPLLCVRARNARTNCSACLDACSAASLTFADNRPSIHAETCTKCYACVAACSTGAITTSAFDGAALLRDCVAAARAADGVLCIACASLLEKAAGLVDLTKVVSVPCVDAVTAELLVEAVAYADITRIHAAHDSCATCALHGGCDAAQRALDEAAELASAWGAPVSAKLSEKLPGAARLASDDKLYNPNRRLFFEEMRSAAKKTAATSLDYALSGPSAGCEAKEEEPKVSVNRYGVLPQVKGSRREGLLAALLRLKDLGAKEAPKMCKQENEHTIENVCAQSGACVQENTHMVGKGLWATLDIDVLRCDGCRFCATLCPTGALYKFHTKTGEIGLKHIAARCVGCGSCRVSCAKGALTLTPGAAKAVIDEYRITRIIVPQPQAAKRIFDTEYNLGTQCF